MEPRNDENREPEKAPEAPQAEQQPKLKRFRVVKLEERIAPVATSLAAPCTCRGSSCGSG